VVCVAVFTIHVSIVWHITIVLLMRAVTPSRAAKALLLIMALLVAWDILSEVFLEGMQVVAVLVDHGWLFPVSHPAMRSLQSINIIIQRGRFIAYTQSI
jgi:hypothetical protein